MLAASVLTVGDGMTFERIEDAVAAAQPNAIIEVYPSAAGYKRTAIRLTKPGITLRAKGLIALDGTGFDYSGSGSVPRAIIQVDAVASGATIDGFTLKGAHNSAHNGAGIRINAASNVTIRRCEIAGNDMGIMSNGVEGDPKAGDNQRIEDCDIHDNGDATDPGYNHNLYLGGTLVTVERCEIHGALTGHNVKSRAHFTAVLNCHIYGGDNRQIDLVDAWDTDRPNSNAVIAGCLIETKPDATGNRNVIHFGQERGTRQGTLYVIGDTIETQFNSPVVLIDSPTCSAKFEGNIVLNAVQQNPVLFQGSQITALNNWGSPVYRDPSLRPIDWNARPVPLNYIDGLGKNQTAPFLLHSGWRVWKGGAGMNRIKIH